MHKQSWQQHIFKHKYYILYNSVKKSHFNIQQETFCFYPRARSNKPCSQALKNSFPNQVLWSSWCIRDCFVTRAIPKLALLDKALRQKRADKTLWLFESSLPPIFGPYCPPQKPFLCNQIPQIRICGNDGSTHTWRPCVFGCVLQ